ncbi:hypothetical protein BH09PLA1_BH09PLA1_14470 [soil metagenome]
MISENRVWVKEYKLRFCLVLCVFFFLGWPFEIEWHCGGCHPSPRPNRKFSQIPRSQQTVGDLPDPRSASLRQPSASTRLALPKPPPTIRQPSASLTLTSMVATNRSVNPIDFPRHARPMRSSLLAKISFSTRIPPFNFRTDAHDRKTLAERAPQLRAPLRRFERRRAAGFEQHGPSFKKRIRRANFQSARREGVIATH